MRTEDADAAKATAADRAKRFLEALTPALVAKEDAIALRLRSEAASVRSRLTKIYTLVDEITGAAGPYVACQRGCSACCKMNVSITAAEAERLSQATGRVPALLSRPVSHSLEDFRGVPCPFLVNGECSVYAARPFACRHHLSFDTSPYWCEPERSGTVELARVRLDGATQAIFDIATSSRMGGFADIRDFFPVPPRAPSGTTDAP